MNGFDEQAMAAIEAANGIPPRKGSEEQKSLQDLINIHSTEPRVSDLRNLEDQNLHSAPFYYGQRDNLNDMNFTDSPKSEEKLVQQFTLSNMPHPAEISKVQSYQEATQPSSKVY